MSRFFFALTLAALSATAQAPATSKTYESVDAVLWTQTSAEYQASARQVYAAARAALDRALATPSWVATLEGGSYIDPRPMPPAVILDLDETVLDNSAYRAQLAKAGKHFTLESWNAWVAEGRAGLVPGAREFLLYARMRGVWVHYITNRDCKADGADPTYKNINALGVPGILHCRTDTSDKSPRRNTLVAQYRVLLLIGDDLNDFVTAATTPEARQKQMEQYGALFGDRWFILPNAMYGSWDRFYGDDLAKKLAALKP